MHRFSTSMWRLIRFVFPLAEWFSSLLGWLAAEWQQLFPGCAAFFGGDDHDAVGSAHAIDGDVLGVLEHLDGFDVVGVNHAERSGIGDTVEHIERLGAGMDGVNPAYDNGWRRSWGTRGGVDKHARLSPLEGRCDARDVAVGVVMGNGGLRP